MKNQVLSRIVVGVASVTVGVGLALAASVHFKKDPTFTDNGTTLTTCVSLAGLGNADCTIRVSYTGDGTTLCENGGDQQAPGINKKDLGGTVSATIPKSEIKNGTLTACLTTDAPTISSAEAGCPNHNWSATITDVAFKTVTITVIQNGQIVLQQTF